MRWPYDEEEFTEIRVRGRRVENQGKSVEDWSDLTGNGSSTHNLCERHARQLDKDPHAFDLYLEPYNGDPVGEDGWGGDCACPPFNDNDYRCALPFCRVLLGD